MYGATDKSKFLGKNIFDFIAKPDRQRAMDVSLKMIMSGQDSAGRYWGVIKGGEAIEVEVATSLLKDASGETIGFVNVMKKLCSARQQV
jgi:PAS domain S-box-containing protein